MGIAALHPSTRYWATSYWCRLRESNTRLPRYEGGALPSELSRRNGFVLKIDKWSAAALPQSKATLQQGLPHRAKRGAAGQFWTFTMSNSEVLVCGALRRFT